MGGRRAGAREIARIPAAALTSDAIVHARVASAPTHRRGAPAPGAPAMVSDRLPERGMDPGAVLLGLLGSANLASRHAVYHQYDSTVGADTVAGPGRGAAVLRVKGTTRALVATTDGNQSVGAFDPWLGAALSVAEATRNVSITGARPLGVTNCLNYGDPTRPEAFWQLSEGVRGLADACRALALPVTGGNVSLYNESPAGAIAPTPVIGVVGLLDDIATLVGPAFVQTHDAVLLVGETVPGLAGSAYAVLAGGATEDDPPMLDLAREAAVQAFVREAIGRGLVASAQDVSGGGLAVALAEGAMWSGLGASVRVAVGHSPAVDLFGEGPSRLVVTCRPRYGAALTLLARQHGLPVETIGSVGGDRLLIELSAAGTGGAVEDRGGGVADLARGARPRPPSRVGPRAGPRPRLGDARLMCGVFGVVLPGPQSTDAASIAALGLFALQHRGQESAGLAVSDGEQLMLYKDLGMISTVLDERRLPSLRGQLAIAHCRYSTTGSTIWENAQPTYRLGPRRALAIGHNGNLVNTRDLLELLKGGRSRLPASTDTELLTALLADEPAADTVEALRQVLPRVRGAYSLVVLDERRVIGVRDPFGFRPLVLGRLPAVERATAVTACGATTTPLPAGACRPRRRPSTSSARSTCATSSRARWSSSSRARRRARSGSPTRRPRCASSS